MVVIGVDFSLNSPSFCIRDLETEKIEYISFIAKHIVNKGTAKKIEELNQFEDISVYYIDQNITIEPTAEIKTITKNLDFIVSTIQQKAFDIEHIVFEGFSYMSTSSRLYQFAGANYLLRERFVNLGYDISVVPPTKAKMLAGKGNANKEMMIEFFLEKSPEHNLKTFMLDQPKMFKPLDDLVDSYWINQTYLKV